MVAAANRFLSNVFLLSKRNLGRHLLHSGTYFIYENGGVAGAGIEPATRGFSVHCSTN